MQLTSTILAFLLSATATLGAVEPGFCPSPEEDPDCHNCGLSCYRSYDPPALFEKCLTECLDCRRESSACAFVHWNHEPECDVCVDNCVCTIGHECNPKPIPNPTMSSVPTAGGVGNLRDLFGEP